MQQQLELSTRALHGGQETVRLGLYPNGPPWLLLVITPLGKKKAVECHLHIVTADGRCGETRPTTLQQATALLCDTSIGWALTRVYAIKNGWCVLEFEWEVGIDRYALTAVCAPFFF